MSKKRKKIKGSINYNLKLDSKQEEVFKSIKNNDIVIVTGDAGTGKTIVTAMSALDMVFRKNINQVYITRALEEVGKSMGYLPGMISDKFDPYIEPFMNSVRKIYSHQGKVEKLIKEGVFQPYPTQFIRGKTIEAKEILFVEEAQNFSKYEMLAILTRLGKRGKIVISGDNFQKDSQKDYTGLHYALELSKAIKGIKHFNLTENHRSGIVREIIEYEKKSV